MKGLDLVIQVCQVPRGKDMVLIPSTMKLALPLAATYDRAYLVRQSICHWHHNDRHSYHTALGLGASMS